MIVDVVQGEDPMRAENARPATSKPGYQFTNQNDILNGTSAACAAPPKHPWLSRPVTGSLIIEEASIQCISLLPEKA